MAKKQSEEPTATARPNVFISYSHRDRNWMDRLREHLLRAQLFVLGDTRITIGVNWIVELERAINQANVVVLLFSPDYLASNWIIRQAWPNLLERQRRIGLHIISILLAPCKWEEIEWLRGLQVYNRTPVAELTKAGQEQFFNEVTDYIVRLAGQSAVKPPAQTEEVSVPPPASSSSEAAAVEDVPSQTIAEPTARSSSSESLSIENLAGFELSGEAKAILQRARVLAAFASEEPPQVTTSCLFFAITEGGRNSNQIMKTPEFLWQELSRDEGELYANAFDLKFPRASLITISDLIDSAPSTAEANYLTPNALSVFQMASDISKKTYPRAPAKSSKRSSAKAARSAPHRPGRIHARHLLAALLLFRPANGRNGAMARLSTIIGDEKQLRERFCDFIAKSLPNDNHEEWRAILLAEEADRATQQSADATTAQKEVVSAPVTGSDVDVKAEPVVDANLKASLAGFLTDYWHGEDLLDITPDVNALASLVAAWSVEPPLSIGLFGDWGSGKSHFMRQMQARVAHLSLEARKSELPQNQLGYYKNIVQIEFNAWHYIEGNLWASLVEHIFEHLKLSDEEDFDLTEARRAALIEKLGVKKQIQAKVDRRKDQLKDQETKARERASDARIQRDSVAEDLLLLRDELKSSVLKQLNLPIEFSAEQEESLKQLGIPKASLTSAEAVHQRYLESKSLWQRLRAQWRVFRNDPRQLRRWAVAGAVLLIPLLVALLLPLLYQALTSNALSKVYASLATALTFVLTLLAGAKPYWEQLRKGLNTLKEKNDEIEYERQKKINELDNDVRLLNQQYKEAEHEAEAINRQVKELEIEIAGTTTSKLLADFIEDRAAASDYRRHLGVLALIRRDFENLAGLFGEQRKAERKGSEARDDKTINRIILYIDDLDRCPPERVVQVLQAIHLLLAFPLFVVVVGVDARWITRSLQESYEWLRAEEDEEAGDQRPAAGKIQGATPHDYLEKIFQIPFWLKPMGKDACKTFLDGLTKESLAGAGTNGGASTTTDDGRQAEEQRINDAGVNRLERQPDQSAPAYAASARANESNVMEQQQLSGGKARAMTAKSVADATPTIVSEPVSATELEEIEQAVRARFGAEKPFGADKDQAKKEIEEIDLQPQSLKITAEEIAYMKELSLLIGRSPRAVKRFLNCYRLIKVGLRPAELARFIGEHGESDEYKAVMILLGLITGAPSVSLYFIEELEKWKQVGHEDSMQEFLNALQQNPEVKEQPDWARVRELLESHIKTEKTLATLEPLKTVVARVSRYSFKVSRVEAAGQKKAQAKA